jgi:hypothetical protein
MRRPRPSTSRVPSASAASTRSRRQALQRHEGDKRRQHAPVGRVHALRSRLHRLPLHRRRGSALPRQGIEPAGSRSAHPARGPGATAPPRQLSRGRPGTGLL